MEFLNKLKAKSISIVEKVKTKLSPIIEKINVKVSPIISKIKFHLIKILKILFPKSLIEDKSFLSRFKLLALFTLYFFIFQFIIVSTSIFVVVKMGGKSVVLPNVEGLEMFTAFNELQKNGMTLQIESHLFPDLPLGTIVIQTPSPGTKVKRGRSVSLVVNMASQNILFMPDLSGKTYEEALSIITNDILANLPDVKILPIVNTAAQNQQNGIVLSHIPLPNEPLEADTEILITVNKIEKDNNIEIENYFNKDAVTIIRELESKGVNVTIQNIDTNDPDMIGKVVSQSLKKGTYRVSSLENITLGVGNNPNSDTIVMNFRYIIPTERTKRSVLKITLDDNNGRTTLIERASRAGETISFNYRLSGDGVITIFYDNTPFESREVR